MSVANQAANIVARRVNSGRNAEGDLSAHEPQCDSLDSSLDRVSATAQPPVRARTVEVSLAAPALHTPAKVCCGADRWQAAARRVCQEMQHAGGIGSMFRYSSCVKEAFRDVLRLALR